MRVVCDTNVVVSALVFGRRLAWLRRAWATGRVTPIVCRETTLADYLPYAETTRLPRPLPVVPVACRDRDDVVFLQLAIASGAELLVTGDSDLTALSKACAVVSPGMLRRLVEPGL